MYANYFLLVVEGGYFHPSLRPFATKQNVMSPSEGWDKDRLGDLMICAVQRLLRKVRASLFLLRVIWGEFFLSRLTM